ncbi:MAG TPA: hydrogenase maturation protease [Candidatus Binatia bacterium]|jgi:hydrogenase maturation protease
MTPRARIIALGQDAAGDDGVGFAILEWLRRHPLGDDVELVRAREDVALVGLLETPAPVVLIDAVLGTPAGEVLAFAPEDLAARASLVVSTHGLGIAQAIELARVLAPDEVSSCIRIVGVTIARPQRYEQGLSPAVAAAVPRAGERVLAEIAGC